MTDKKDIIQACISMWEEEIRKMDRSVKTVRGLAIDAVGSMSSWSDTTKFQQSQIADGLSMKMEDAKLILNQFKVLPPTVSDTIAVGAVFALRDSETSELNHYLVVKRGGGSSFQVDQTEINLISLEAPLLRVVLGKNRGDGVIFQGRELEITEVQ